MVPDKWTWLELHETMLISVCVLMNQITHAAGIPLGTGRWRGSCTVPPLRAACRRRPDRQGRASPWSLPGSSRSTCRTGWGHGRNHRRGNWTGRQPRLNEEGETEIEWLIEENMKMPYVMSKRVCKEREEEGKGLIDWLNIMIERGPKVKNTPQDLEEGGTGERNWNSLESKLQYLLESKNL